MTMAAFAGIWLWKISPQEFAIPVLDRTGIEGAWDFGLDYTLPFYGPMSNGETPDPNGPTVFDAVQQVGLTLELRKLPSDVIIVDSASRTPSPN
jgi:uncharacterized protein (TIGR03435 family)